MYPLLQRTRTSIGEVFWRRSAPYKNRTRKLGAAETADALTFNGTVMGTALYHLELGIKKPGGALRGSCDCPSFHGNGRCKHIGGFARKIAEEFEILDDLTLRQPQGNPPGKPVVEPSAIPDKPSSRYMVNPKLLTNLPKNIDSDMIDFFLEHHPEFLIKKSDAIATATPSPLDILSGISASPAPENPGEEHMRIKVEMIHGVNPNKNNLFLSLYQGKIQKTGNLSVGKKLFRSDLYGVKYQKFAPFLEERNGGYAKWGNSSGQTRLSFKSAPEFFIQLLSQATEPVSNSKNVPLLIKKAKSQLRIDVAKIAKDGTTTYAVSLFLQNGQSRGENVPLGKQILFHANGTDYFAYVENPATIWFFQTELPPAFVFSLCQNEVVLSEAEWTTLRNNPEFEKLLEHAGSIGFLEDEAPLGTPELLLEIEIDPDFREILVRYRISYGSKTVSPNADTKYFMDGNRLVRRNPEKEKAEIEKIRDLMGQADALESEACSFSKAVDERSDRFFDTVEALVKEGIRVEYRQAAKRVSSSPLSVRIDVGSGEDWFDLDVTFSIGERELTESKEILRAMKRWGKYVTLDNGTVLLLKHDAQKTLKEWDELGITEKTIGDTVKIGKYSIGLLRETAKWGFVEFQLAKEIVQLKRSLENFSGIKKYPLPADATAKLREYQHTGYDWLRFLQEYGFSGILADDMGLGKTIQTLVFLQSEHDKESTVSPTLIVVPTSLVLNWMDEAEKFVPKLRIQYVKDGKTGFADIRPDTQIVVVSYGIVANLVEAPGFENRKFHYVILDEAQNIKNLAAARTKSVLKLRATHRLAISGTPIENNLMELFSIFNFLMPGFVGSESSFREKYAKGDAEHLEILSRKVKPFILRRKKEEVLKELPAKQEDIVYLEMGPEQKTFYEGLKTAFKAQIFQKITENGLAKSQFAVLDALLKLRQACLMPRLVTIGDHCQDESIKLRYIEENIEEMINSGHNLLVFSQFTGFLAYVRQMLERKGIPHYYLDGTTKREDRKKLVDGFNAGAAPVFLISLKAGGTGLNLTGADYVIHLDPWWNPAVENQATDRAHRMGQTKTVFVQKLIVRDTVEEKILKLQTKKKKLVDDLFSGDFHGNLSEEDIGYIFE